MREESGSADESEEDAKFSVCRICLAMNVKMYYIYGYNLSDMYQRFTGIQVRTDDKLPVTLCWECAARLTAANRFIQKALKTQWILMKRIKDSGIISTTNIKSIDRSKHRIKSTLSSKFYNENDILHITEGTLNKDDVDNSNNKTIEETVKNKSVDDKIEIDLEDNFNNNQEQDNFNIEETQILINKIDNTIERDPIKIEPDDVYKAEEIVEKFNDKIKETINNNNIGKNKIENEIIEGDTSEDELLSDVCKASKRRRKSPATLRNQGSKILPGSKELIEKLQKIQDSCEFNDDSRSSEDDHYLEETHPPIEAETILNNKHNIMESLISMDTIEEQKYKSHRKKNWNSIDSIETPQEMLANAHANGTNKTLSLKSKERYQNAYEHFIKWKNSKKDTELQPFCENLFMTYFNELGEKYKPTTMWNVYSMLRSSFMAEDGIDLREYSKLNNYLKSLSKGYTCQKSKTLSLKEIERFLEEAPDDKFLATKVALIFGVAGACSVRELVYVTEKDIENHGTLLLITINNPETKRRSFTVVRPFYDIVIKYMNLRSKKAKQDRFFQNYHNGKCKAQPIGKNMFALMPKNIAKFLGLPDVESYTGFCFKRSSATMLAEPIRK